MTMSRLKCSSWAQAATRDDKSSSEDVEPDTTEDTALAAQHLKPTPTNTRRCRHLEECMFPRYLNLDTKTIDDFCIGIVQPEHQGKNAARLYIESLHLKPFMKDKETLTEERNNKRKGVQMKPSSPKRPCLPLRRNSLDHKTKSDEPSTKVESGEGVVDKKTLAQMYFGGFDGKRACFLSNNGAEAGGGVAASYCQIIPSMPLQSLHHSDSEQNAGVLKSKKHETTNNTSSSDEKFNDMLSSEKKLATLRNQMKLYNRLDVLDNFVVSSGQSSTLMTKDGEAQRLQGLIVAIDGYVPPSIDASGSKQSDASAERGSNVVDETKNKTDGSPTQKNLQTPENTSDSKSKNSSPDKSSSPEKCDAQVLANTSPTHYTDAYRDAVKEGQAQSMAANMLLESFRCNRRSYLSNREFKCAWCSSTADGSKIDCCSGDGLIQCLDCNLVGCGTSLSMDGSCGKQHMMLHFLISGHRYGVSCGPLGELYCMGCGDFVHQECFDQERERLYIQHNYPSLSWSDQPILRGVDASSFVVSPEQGHIWQGLQATYPIRVPSNLVMAARSVAKRLSIFHGQAGERSVEWNAKSLELSLYIKEHLTSQMIPEPVGLYNMGNTCFMSAVLHCLVNCKQLENLFLLDIIHPYQSCKALCNGSVKSCLACEFDKVFIEYFGSANGIDAIAALEENEPGSLSSSRFLQKKDISYTKKQEINRCGHPIILSSFLAESWKQVGMKQLAGQNQNDAQEFLSSFINALASSDTAYLNALKKLKKTCCPSQIKQSAFHIKKDESIGVSKAKDIFTGSLRSILTCNECNQRRTQVESFNNVSLPITKQEADGQITIESCLENFTKPDLLPDLVHCPSCDKSTGSSQQHAFVVLPEVLCLHLKRFDAAANKKLTDKVSFPEHGLDMGKYLAQCSTQSNNNNPRIIYDLFATVNHNGSLDKGHYTASIRKGKHWYTINDEFVSNAGDGNGENEVLSNANAYMLFYSRRERF